MVALSNRAKRFVTSERKSFDLSLEGVGKDRSKITTNGHRRRSSVILSKEEMKWLEGAWRDLWKEGKMGWFRRRRERGQTLLIQVNQNKWGRMVIISVLNGREYRVVMCPEGVEKAGWRDFSNVLAVLMGLVIAGEGGKRGNFNVNAGGSKGKVLSSVDKRIGSRLVFNEQTWGKVKVDLCYPGCGKVLNTDVPLGGSKMRSSFREIAEGGKGESVGVRDVGQVADQGRGSTEGGLGSVLSYELKRSSLKPIRSGEPDTVDGVLIEVQNKTAGEEDNTIEKSQSEFEFQSRKQKSGLGLRNGPYKEKQKKVNRSFPLEENGASPCSKT